jgi:hypothetical protein
MDEKDIKYLSSLDTDQYTATEEEITRTYSLMLELEKSDHQEKPIVNLGNRASRSRKTNYWKYAVSLSAAALIILAILVVPGLFNNHLVLPARQYLSVRQRQ